MSRKSSIKKVMRNNNESKDLQRAIMMDLYLRGYSPIVANFTGGGLSECDVLAVSKADLMYEYEIKISRSDFKKDFTKTYKHGLLESRRAVKELWRWKDGQKVQDGKWFLIPNYFVYLCPKDLLKIEDVPEYAGLVYVCDDYKTFETVKKAPKLHDNRVDDGMIRKIAHNLSCKQIFGSSYMRYIQKINEENAEQSFDENK